jgi:hypothetical protein
MIYSEENRFLKENTFTRGGAENTLIGGDRKQELRRGE